MRSGVILKKVRSLKLPTIRPGKLLVVLMQVFFILSTYSGIIIPLAELNPVLAAPTSTDGYYDCIVSSPTYFNGEECYIRGTYLPHSGWNPDAGCFMTNRVYYPSSGQQYTFCDPLRTAALTNREVIGFVRWNGNGTFNILNVVELAETFNQPPNQPSMIRPQSGWEMGPRNNGAYTGVSCNTSGTGLGCSVDFATTSFDPDFYQWIRLESEITRNQGGNQNFNQQLNSNNETYTRNLNLNDGNWNYRARNCDTTGECSGFTGYRTFLVDTTAPTGVNMAAEPTFSPTTQNTVSSTVGSDNVVGGIEYEFQIDDDPTFASPNNSSGWITTNSFAFASLTDEQTYHYRVRSRDRLYNTSNWGTTTSSSQDSTLPVISNVALNHQRISPQNVDGQFDSADLSLEWTEKYPQEARLEVLDSSNNIIRSIVTPLPTGSTTPVPLQFNWNGRDNGGTLVVDGPYVLRVVVRDLAGNEASNDSSIVIVDNLPADISVSTPATGSWFRQSAITINGQTEAGALAWITNNQNATQTQLTLDGLGLFAHSDSLGLGANSFLLNAQDSVLNASEITVNYYREEVAPSIDAITPDSLINNRRPEIRLSLSDSGYNDGTNDYISGVDPNSVFISLSHPSSGELVLVNGGVNTQPALGSIVETCSAAGAFGNSTAPSCTYKFVFSADLTPDGDYLITARVSDKAGNSAAERTQAFKLDSNIHSEVNSPASGNLFNYSKITVTGTSEINSEVLISLPLGDVDGDGNVDTQSFIVLPSEVNDPRVAITNCRPSSAPQTDGIVEICDWQVSNFQLERDLANAGNVANQIKVDTKDNIDSFPLAGLNQKSQVVDVNVDLYAVTLTINTDIEFFSPNGDGRQDGVNFQDISVSGQVETYTLEIKDSSGVVVKTFSAGGNPPTSIPWDGRNSEGNFVADGAYTYQLKIVTTDEISFETTPVAIQAATTLTNTVVITNPKTNSFSSRGVITVQGQAPQALSNSQTSELKVKICVDTISIAGTCDSEYYTTVDANGFFSTIVMLPRVGLQDEHYLTASAFDKYGNETPPSNQVKVTTTASPPFESVQIIPVLTGTNSPEAYQLILDKLDSGQEITAADINSLRNVVMRSNVFQGTERVRLFFADHSQLTELPGNTDWNSIGYITGDNQTNLYKNFGDGITPYVACASTTCSWDFLFPLPSNLAGLYEIRFEGKLDQEVQNLTAGFTVDGNIPTTPIILDINKNKGGSFVNTNYRGNSFYSNSELIQIRGASDPSALIEVKDNSGNLICSTTASSVGIWSCEVDISSLAGYANPNSNVYTIPLITYAIIGLNTAQSIDNKTVVIDKIAPQIISVNTSSQWRKSGDVVNQAVVANESLSLALSIDKQNPAEIDQCINSTSSFDLNGMQIPVQMAVVSDLIVSSSNLANASGSFIVSGNAVEGRYCTTIGIADLAGNTAEQTQVFFIDNTAPNSPNIDISDWGKFNGINTKPGAIAKGRLVPEFVHEENQVKINAWSEENTSLLFYVNGALVSTNSNAQAQCQQSLEVDKIADSVNVQDKDICLYEFTYPLSKNGKDYAFQVKSIDRAGNLSIISEDEVVYYDNQNPINPEVLRTASPSYDPTPGWMLGLKNSLTKDTSVDITARAESLSDLEFSTSGPQNFKNYIFTQTPGNQVATQTIPLGSSSDEREGCVQTIDTRRTGVCQDGNYEVSIKSTDAAGNPSAVTKHTVERDTVRPARASQNILPDLNHHELDLLVIGESQGTALIEVNGNGRTWSHELQLSGKGNAIKYNLVGTWWPDTLYKVVVKVKDRAGNIGEAVETSYRTPKQSFCFSTGNKPFAFPLDSGFEIRQYYNDNHKAIDLGFPGGPANTFGKSIKSIGAGFVSWRRDANTAYQYNGVIKNNPRGGSITITQEINGLGKVYYVHLSEVNLPVAPGEKIWVAKGQVIGKIGNTGIVKPRPLNANDLAGTHLHLSIYSNGRFINPLDLLGECRGIENLEAGSGEPVTITVSATAIVLLLLMILLLAALSLSLRPQPGFDFGLFIRQIMDALGKLIVSIVIFILGAIAALYLMLFGTQIATTIANSGAVVHHSASVSMNPDDLDDDWGKKAKEKGFRDEGKLDGHFRDHGKEFNSPNKYDYQNKAMDHFTKKGNGNDIYEGFRNNGDRVIYDKSANAYGAQSTDGTIKTFFKPTAEELAKRNAKDGVDYFFKSLSYGQ